MAVQRPALVFIAALAMAGVATGPQLAARQRGRTQAATAFRVAIDYVNVDATVTDDQGRFVRDLRPDEFEVYEDGRRQQVDAVTLVDIPFEPPGVRSSTAPPSPAAAEPDVRANDMQAGRVFVIVLDDLHVHPMRTTRVKDVARLFVDRYLGPDDLAAVIHSSGRPEATQDFTSSAPLLRRAIDAFAGRNLRSSVIDRMEEYQGREDTTTRADQRLDRVADPLDKLRADNARQMLRTVTAVSDLLSAGPGRRKTLVLISEGLNYPLEQGLTQTASGISMFSSPSAPIVFTELRDAIRAAARANIAVYAVDPRGLATTTDEQTEYAGYVENPLTGLTPDAYREELRQMQDSLRIFSDETGGAAAVMSNDFSKAFDRIVAESSTYYLLGYHSGEGKRDGKYRRIEVRVKRPGIKVRARQGYLASPPSMPAGAITEVNESSSDLRDALNSPLPLPGVPLRLFAAPFKGGKGGSVAVGVEADARGFTFTEKDGLFRDSMAVSIVALDAQGKFAAGDRYTVDLQLKPETYQAVRDRGLRVLFRLDLTPGRYQLRAAAHESGNSRTGSVTYDLEVPDFSRAPLVLSGLSLTATGADVIPTAKLDPVLSRTLPTPPTGMRRFSARDTVTTYFELYGGGPGTPQDVDVVTSLRTPDGQVRVVTQERTSAMEMRTNGGGVGYAVRVPLTAATPGRHVLRVEARPRNGGDVLASREIPFTIQP